MVTWKIKKVVLIIKKVITSISISKNYNLLGGCNISDDCLFNLHTNNAIYTHFGLTSTDEYHVSHRRIRNKYSIKDTEKKKEINRRICGKIHDINKICRRKITKKNSETNNFRKTYSWTEKIKMIRKRDRYLCRVCETGKYGTEARYNYKELQVHHIIPIQEDYSKRLDSTNLIILCRLHHDMAERGKIPSQELQKNIMMDK